MGTKDGNIQNPCACGHFLVPIMKEAYKSYRITFFFNLKEQNVLCDG